MNNTALTPLVIGNTKFRIPLYQRPYAWEEIQVMQLLEDLHDSYNNDNLPKQHYYIGILSVAPIDDDTEIFDLIDGQQRITTLMLIGKVAMQYHNRWADFLHGRLDLYGRKDDQDYLDFDISGSCNSKMIATVDLAKKFFNDKKIEQENFSKYIYEHAAFFLSTVPASYSLLDKNQQFVRMNNRGKQLEKHEILKVQLLSEIDDKEGTYTDIWNNMLQTLTGISGETHTAIDNSLVAILNTNNKEATESHVEVFYSAIVTVPEFLLIALFRCKFDNIFPKLNFNTDKLLEIFAPLKEHLEEIKIFFDVLKLQTIIFRKFFIFRSINSKAMYELGVEDNTNEEYLKGENGDNERLKMLQSFLYVSTEPHHWLIPALEYCKEKNSLYASDFVDLLESIDNKLNAEKTRNLTSIEDVNSMTYNNNISRYWFYRLDYELWKLYKHSDNKCEDSIWASISKDAKSLINEFVFRRSGSIEHIKPQHPIGAEGMAVIADHSFGNLALISSSRNSKFNNNPPDGKKSIILNSKYIESLKMAHFLWGNNGGTSFEQYTEKHCNLMYKILRDAVE